MTPAIRLLCCVAVLAAVAPACGESVAVTRSAVADAPAPMEVFAPDLAGPLPVAVLVPGGAWRTAELESTAPLARELAARGFVVFNASYRLNAAVAFADVACAVRLAVERAPALGGDPNRLLLAGHSAGAHVTAVVALGGAAFPGECPVQAPFAPPTAWAGIAGVYQLELARLSPDVVAFFGGTPAEHPELWRAGNPLTYLDGAPPVELFLVHGRADIVAFPVLSRFFADALGEAGIDVELIFVEGADHAGIIDPEVDGHRTLDVLERALEGGE